MGVYCDTLTKAGMSASLIPAVEGKTIVITAIAIQNESTTDVTAIVYSTSKNAEIGTRARRRICMPNKADGFDRVYFPGRELKGLSGGDITISLSVDAAVGVSIEWFYQ